MRVALGSDHAGFDYKERLKLFLIETGHVVEDFGTYSDKSCDYPEFIRPVAEAVAAGEFDRGIVLGGSGNGEAIVANRVPGVRCALCWNLQTALWGREHNDANVLALGQRTVDFEDAKAIVETWLETPFEGGRHERRIRQIDNPAPGPGARKKKRPMAPLPHRADLIESATLTCNACGESFSVPIDISAGGSQQLTEECPTCCRENTLVVTVDSEGEVLIQEDSHFP